MPLHLPDPSCRAPVGLAELAENAAVLGSWLLEHRRLWDGMDEKAAAAVLLGGLSSEVIEAILASAPEAANLACPRAADLSLDLTWAAWVEGATSTPVLTYRVGIAGATGRGRPDAATGLAELLGPLVAALARASGLGLRALWRIVTDSVAQACLEDGRRRGDEVSGMALARAILDDRGSPLFNRQWGFFEVEAHRPDGRSVREWFRARGGCCRYYTTAAGVTCSTCVLRDPASRDAILRDWLATRAEAA